MKKSNQIEVNRICMEIFDGACEEMYREAHEKKQNPVGKRLNKCNALVFETEHFYILQSYNTLIAAIRKGNAENEWCCANAMRHEYDFEDCTSSTSTQHFWKFVRKYVPAPQLANVLTYKAV